MSGEPNYEGTVRYIPCANCGSGNPATASTCARCGKPLQAASNPPVARPNVPQASQRECPKCHKTFAVGSKFCGYCGTPLVSAAPVTTPQPAPWPVASQPVAPSNPPRVIPQAPAPAVPRLSPAAPAPPRTLPQPLPPKVTTPTPPAARPQPPAISPPEARPTPPAPTPTAGKVDSRLPAAVPEGTLVFDGFRMPSIEAQISERKHDGSWGSPLQIVGGVSIGRSNCEINYPDDPRLADRHALLSNRQGKLFLEDCGSLSGTFVRQRQDTELVPGDIFLLGQDLFRFTTQSLDEAEKPGTTQGTVVWASPPVLQRGPITAKLEHILLTGEVIEEFRLETPETTLGRTNANLVFKDDHYMSGTHARIVAQPGRFVLQDLRSRNGVFRRVRNEIELEAGDEFFMGEHLFRVEIKRIS